MSGQMSRRIYDMGKGGLRKGTKRERQNKTTTRLTKEEDGYVRGKEGSYT